MKNIAISKCVILTKMLRNFPCCNALHIRVSVHKPRDKSHGLKPMQMKLKYRNTSIEERVWKA